jgi:hypothetical protein
MKNSQLSRYGAIARSLPFTFGNIFFVADPAQSYLGDIQDMFPVDEYGVVRVFTSLNAAYDACVSGRNDVIILDGNSTHDITPIAWTKSRINVIGLGELRTVQQGAKVQSATAGTEAYVIKVTGVRNSFKNIKFIQSSTEATALTAVQDGGEGTFWDHCSFTFGVADNLDLTTAHEFLAGCDSSYFRKCTFGQDTLLTSAARSVFHIDQINGYEFKSNQFDDCTWVMSSSSSTATFIRLDAVGDILFSNVFRNPVFMASVDSAGGAAVAEAIQTGTGTVKGCLAFHNIAAFNCTDVATATSGRNAAVQIVGVTTTAGTGGVGIQPTA